MGLSTRWAFIYLRLNVNLQTIRETATGIALQAGAELMRFYNQPHQEVTKQNHYDIVTEGDKASEAIIVPALHRAFPDHHVYSEEGGGSGVSPDKAEYFWYIDPLDGTTNYANNIPHFSVSIALADHNNKPLVGVVFNPVYNEMFTAAQGFGATLNGRAIHVSGAETLGKSVLSTGFPYTRASNEDNNLREWGSFLPIVRDLRRFGSAALDLCFVAAGRFDGFWEAHLNPWDCMAGIICVREAGGIVTDYSGGEANLLGDQLIASNKYIHPQIKEVIATSRQSVLAR
jgi:myo-inositol-1(or 4)-monophosphatase